MGGRITAPQAPTRGLGGLWRRAHGLEVALALPLVLYLMLRTAAPIVAP